MKILKKIMMASGLICGWQGVQAADGDWDVNLSAYLGHKSLNDSDWPRIDSQASFGVLFDFKKDRWPVSIALDLISSAEAFDINVGSLRETSVTFEQHFGVRKYFMSDAFKPYVGGGVANIQGEIRITNEGVRTKNNDNEVGYWLGVGAHYEFNSQLLLGVDLRYSKASGEVFEIEREMGGFHSGVTIGYSW